MRCKPIIVNQEVMILWDNKKSVLRDINLTTSKKPILQTIGLWEFSKGKKETTGRDLLLFPKKRKKFNKLNSYHCSKTNSSKNWTKNKRNDTLFELFKILNVVYNFISFSWRPLTSLLIILKKNIRTSWIPSKKPSSFPSTSNTQVDRDLINRYWLLKTIWGRYLS